MSGKTQLDAWAKQGVLLLNTSLTVVQGQPTSHSKCGWQTITKEIVKIINELNQPIVFMLWGGHAKGFTEILTEMIEESVFTFNYEQTRKYTFNSSVLFSFDGVKGSKQLTKKS